MKGRVLLIDPQNSYNPRNVISIQRRHVFSGFKCQLYRGHLTETHALLSSNIAACFWKASYSRHIKRKCYVQSPN